MKTHVSSSSAALWIVASWLVVVRGDRAYPLGCSQQPPSYYNYDSYPFPPPGLSLRSTDDYLLLRRLGAGKFSDVFEAVDVELEQKLGKEMERVDPRTLVVLKVHSNCSCFETNRQVMRISHGAFAWSR